MFLAYSDYQNQCLLLFAVKFIYYKLFTFSFIDLIPEDQEKFPGYGVNVHETKSQSKHIQDCNWSSVLSNTNGSIIRLIMTKTYKR